MRERFTESVPENGLEAALKKRKNFFEKLADSPYKWVLMSVLALEQQACAGLPRQVGWIALEPNASGGVDAEIKYGQQGTGMDYVPRSSREAIVVDAMRGLQREQEGPESPSPQSVSYIGPRAYLEFIPPNVRPSFDKIPEGFNGKDIQNIFAVAHGTPRDLMRRISDRSRTGNDRLDNIMRTSIRPEEIQQERLVVANRAFNLLLPNLPDRRWGVRMEWKDVQALVPEQGRMLTVSCRISPWAAPSSESADARITSGHMLEHEVLSDDQEVWANLGGDVLYFSTTEKSVRFPQTPAQAAFAGTPIKLDNWNAVRNQRISLVRRLEALSSPDFSVSQQVRARNKAEAARLQIDISKLTDMLDAAYMNARLNGLNMALSKMSPLIRDNEIRFYFRMNDQAESLQVIAILDDPDISKI